MSISETPATAPSAQSQAAMASGADTVMTEATQDQNQNQTTVYTGATNPTPAAQNTAEAAPPNYISRAHLPASLASLFPPAAPPTAKDIETFTHRKAEIMRNMSLADIQALYEKEVAKITDMIEEDRRGNEEVRKQIEMLEKQRELERRIYYNMRESKSAGRAKAGEGSRGNDGAESREKSALLEEEDGDDGKEEEEGEVVEGDQGDVKMEGAG